MAMAIRVSLLFCILFLFHAKPSFSLFGDEVGLADWHQQYIGKVKDAVFHTQKAGRKRVVVSTEENVVASLDLRHGEIFWRHVLGNNDVVDAIDIALGKYVITLSSSGGILRAWNLPDGQMVWESSLQGCSKSSKSLLSIPNNLKVDKDNLIHVFGNGCLHGVSGIDGEIVWKKSFESESIEVQQIIHPSDSEVIYAIGFVGSSHFEVFAINARNGDLLNKYDAAFPGNFSGEMLLVSDDLVVALDATKSKIVTIKFQDGIKFEQTYLLSDLIGDSSGTSVLLPLKLQGMFALEINGFKIFIRITGEGNLEVVDKVNNATVISDPLLLSEGEKAFAIVQHDDDGKIHLTVKLVHDWNKELHKESIVMDHGRGFIHRVFINNYIRTDRSNGFRALVVMEDHSLLLLQQGAIVWSREDGLASIVGVVTSELPVEKEEGVSVSKVEDNFFEWLKGHMLKLKGTLMLASPEDVVVIQGMRVKNSEKSKMTRDHNGFRKLLIVLTRSGKLFALHTGDGRVVWSLLLPSLRNSACGLSIYQWQVPHHHALDENPSVLIVGQCGQSNDAPGVLSFVDTYTGKEISSSSPAHSVSQVLPLPFTDATEQRLHLLIDQDQRAYLYPRTPEAVTIFQREFSNIYWHSVDSDKGIIKGHALKRNSNHDDDDEYCFHSRDVWSIVFPSDSEKIIATVTRKLNEEVVHTQAKIIPDHDDDVMYKYISKNLMFVATVTPKSSGEIGTATPDESSLVVYLIDTISGRILHRMTHHGSQGPVHAVFSENWVVYHYFNLRAHRYQMSVIEIYDQSRSANKDLWKLVLGHHNLTSPISSYSRTEVVTKSQSYFFTHSVKAISVTSTAKGVTSKQLLIGTIVDQVLALDKRFLDPRRSANPSQAEREQGLVPLTDSLPINPQSYVTHSLKVEGLRGIVTVPARLESTTLVFAYGIDLFYTRIAPSRTYDSLTEDFSYALLLITIVGLVAAIFVTWILSEKKDLQDKWR
ncbi:hypothetical protein F8388_001976 [Cannabis sativa]|uniref:ER membrane protein complex subunit 1 n=1 Tax=Cannabis sativa TaxID=3483 RepID=A0A7J6HUT5_CANSA|nr:hypothetical protein F8388_001976 [Cannabis sativa]KAF4398621.1 hypothetical protein G4B88_013710 [Cannabis sativa]